MKATLYTLEGTKKGEVTLPDFFDETVREDLVWRAARVQAEAQPYGIYTEAGKRHSASGIISHKRHDWKGQYGRGIARTPRKILWRRGTQFNWVGAEVSNTRGGRRPHGPKVPMSELKLNKKEARLALRSAIAATSREKFVLQHYETLTKLPCPMPLVVELGTKPMGAKQITTIISKIFGENTSVALSHHDVRAGKGKLRGRRYKTSAGLLMVKTAQEEVKTNAVATCNVDDLRVQDFYPLGRLVMFSEKALEALKKL